jgi:hypothetical protein
LGAPQGFYFLGGGFALKGSGPCKQFGMMFLCMAICLVLVGCGGGKVTSENFMKIQNGMTEKQVTDILGSPTESKDVDFGGAKVKESIWKSGNSSIEIRYDKDGKVAGQKGSFK